MAALPAHPPDVEEGGYKSPEKTTLLDVIYVVGTACRASWHVDSNKKAPGGAVMVPYRASLWGD